MDKIKDTYKEILSKLSNLSIEQRKQIQPYLNDLNKMNDMIESGNHNEELVNEIKNKYEC